MDEVAAQRARLTAAEKKLRDALERFEKAHVKPPAKPAAEPDPRLQRLDQKLQRLLDEVEQLRRELRPQPRQGARPNRRTSMHINSRTFRIPVRVEKNVGVALFVTRDGGKSYQLEVVRRDGAQAFDFRAPADGLYGFQVAPLKDGKAPDGNELPGKEHALWVQIDTAAPEVKLSRTEALYGQVKLAWQAHDDNLVPSTLKFEVRYGNGPWQALAAGSSTATAPDGIAGSVMFVPKERPWEVRASVADQAGNVGTARVGA
jgi:hypothetical protein